MFVFSMMATLLNQLFKVLSILLKYLEHITVIALVIVTKQSDFWG